MTTAATAPTTETTPPAAPAGLRRALSALVDDEEASAAVEFVVLLPVYLLLLTGLFMVGNLLLARQALVCAVRFQAWHPDAASRPGFSGNASAFFAPYAGTFKADSTQRTPVSVAKAGGGDRVAEADLDLRSQLERDRFDSTSAGYREAESAARRLAARLLNNESDAPFILSVAKGSFTYSGVTLGGLAPTQRTTAAVLLPRAHTRKEYEPGQAHPAVAWGGKAFDPSKPENQPLSPAFEPYFKVSGSKKGIWETDARIMGKIQDEHSYFENKPKAPEQ